MRLEAAHVSFRYGRKGPWILEDLSLAVESGQRLGLFAPSATEKAPWPGFWLGIWRPRRGKFSWMEQPFPKKVSARFS
mgnify:CR=1 FL=1